MANYTITNIGNEARVELHDKLSLTGAEVSINRLPAGAGVPFVHYHKHNEEIYGIISGEGKDSDVTYVCIQVKENSLEGFTAGDAVVY